VTRSKHNDTTTATRRPRLAAVLSSWHHRSPAKCPSHAEVIVNRWLTHRDTDAAWGWRGPRSDITAIFADQLFPNDDIHAICREHNIPLMRDVDQALTLGTTGLAVDGVLLIGEHGIYPSNNLGQKFYPRKALFDQIINTYKRTGQTAPVFCDKHFSWNFPWAQQMCDTAERMGFMLLGGSSIPHCKLAQPLPDLNAQPPEEVVAAFSGDPEIAGFHIMELAQSIVEQRRGGETGVRQVITCEGDSLADAQQRGEWSASLAQSAIQAGPDSQSSEIKLAYVVDHDDCLLVPGGMNNWSIAMRCAGDDGNETVYASHPIVGGDADYQGHFARLSRIIDDALVDRVQPFPMRRTLLATGMIDLCMEARAQPGEPRATPELMTAYQADREAPV